MPKLPLVSIIIPCYNAAPRLAACLQSCLTQTYSNLEIIFVDNNSTDDSLQIAQTLAATSPYPIHFHHCPQPGTNYARNHGFTHAQGEYIQWLDADDELDSPKIERQVAALEYSPTHDIACADWEWHYYQQDRLQFRMGFSAQFCSDILLQFLLHHWHPPHAYLLRRRVAQQLHDLQAWHPGRALGRDREYFTLAAILGNQFLRVPGSTVRYYSWSTTQLTRSVPYLKRAEAYQQLFQRFQQQIIQSCSPAQISGLHWFLLRQNWDLWQLAPGNIHQIGTHTFWIERTNTDLGMTLTLGESRMVKAMSQNNVAYTLEDHAHQILRILWKKVVMQPGVKADTIAIELAKWVGLLPVDHSTEFSTSSAPSPALSSSQQSAMTETINTIPLYAPMFPEVRLVILQLLGKLREVGLLQQMILATTEQPA
jgi:hypothetical protein